MLGYSYCLLLVLVFGWCNGLDGTSGYNGYTLLSLRPQTRVQVTFLHSLEVDYEELDFWQPPMVNATCAVLVTPDLLETFKVMLRDHSIPWTIANVNISGTIEATYPKDPLSPLMHGFRSVDSFHQDYHDYPQILAYLDLLASQYPDNVQLSTLNHLTHEGRQVRLVKLHGSTSSSVSAKPAIVMEAGIHAREWVSPAANLYAISKILEGYKAETEVARAMLDKYDWYLIPVTNPDGYAYTHSSSNMRLWRKNRRKISRRCYGVDLNRNFDIEHGTTGVSLSCSSDIYPGPHAFSEPETANVRDLVDSLKDRLVSYLSVHAYSQFVLVPWGYTNSVQRPQNAVELDRVANLMSGAILSSHGKKYGVGTAWQLLEYAASGAAEDWALSVYPDIYAYCYELRPDQYSSVGFLLPPDQIVATGQEYLASLQVLAMEMKV